MMRESPVLPEAADLRATLATAYGLGATAIRFLPLGHDSSAWVYRVETVDGTPRFLKLRAGPLNEAGLRVPHLLHRLGVDQVVAPIPNRAGALWTPLGALALILYPFVDGATGMAAGLTDRQWTAYGAALRAFHAAQVPPELAGHMRQERYAPPGAATIRRADATLQQPLAEPSAQALAQLWHKRRATILQLLERAETLGRQLAQRGLPHVLCHADIHTANVLRDGEHGVWIVDWDEAVLAPKERDLMFVVGGISRALVNQHQESLCLQGYGPATIDQTALAYYRYAWAVSDIAAYSDDVLFRPDLGLVSREAALSGLQTLFTPGEIVAIAQET